MPFTFGIDARAAAEVPAGRGRVVREVLSALAAQPGDERWVLYCREPAALDLDERFRWEPIELPDPAWHVVAARRATRECDGFLSTNSYLTAWFCGIPSVLIIHDLVAFLPGAHAQRRAALIERATIDIGVRRATALLCNSRATRDDLVRRIPSAAGRAVVWPLAADPRFGAPEAAERAAAVASAHGVDGPFVLAAGTLEPRKNLLRLLEAWDRMDDARRRGRQLVLVGPKGWEAEQIVARARTEGVRMPGYVSDEDLAALYAGCDLFVYPSLYEGFGLPVLEAMRAGAAVVTSRVSSLPEVAGDAAVLVDPEDVAAIAEAIGDLLADDPRRRALGAAARVRAGEFSWPRAASTVRDVMRSAARRGA